jgi:hypothetical protein
MLVSFLRHQMIVTGDEALIPNAELAEAAAFAEALAARLRSADGASSSSGHHNGGGSLAATSGSSAASSSAPLLRPRSAGDLTKLEETAGAHAGRSGGGGALTGFAASALRRTPLSTGNLLAIGATPTPPGSVTSTGASGVTPLPRAPPPTVAKPWLLIDSEGHTHTLLLDKHAVAARYAVPLRDLRVLDIGLTTRHVPIRVCEGADASASRVLTRAALRCAALRAAFRRRCCAASAPS